MICLCIGRLFYIVDHNFFVTEINILKVIPTYGMVLP